MIAAFALAKEQGRISVSPAVAITLVLCLATILIRWPNFGNPFYHGDEQYYLLVGRSMLDGAIPYVDIWDRKPLGLFLIYAAIGWLGGDGIDQYQSVAGLFVAGTAITIALIARIFANWVPATLAGITYIAALEVMGGGGGQSPLFYNLFIAIAFLQLVTGKGNAVFAMACCSLAIFIKPTAIAESLMIGGLFLWRDWTATRDHLAVISKAALYAAIGAAPYMLTLLVYAQIGHFDAWLYANITSIFAKAPSDASETGQRAAHLLLLIGPLIAMGGLGLHRLRSSTLYAPLLLWLGAALVGFLLIPNIYNHYALPLAVPLSVAAIGLYAHLPIGGLYAGFVCLWMLSLGQYPAFDRTRQSIISSEAAVRIIKANLGTGCLYVHQGPPSLHNLAGACRLTSRIFPEHLNSAHERYAIGMDPAAEVKRILAAKPSIIVTGPAPRHAPFNPETLSLVNSALAKEYRFVRSLDYDSATSSNRMDIYVRITPAAPQGLIRANAASPDHPK